MKNFFRESENLHDLVRKAVVFHCGTEQFDPLVFGCGFKNEKFEWKEWKSCEDMLDSLKAESVVYGLTVLFHDNSRVNLTTTIYNWKPQYQVEFDFWLENNLPKV